MPYLMPNSTNMKQLNIDTYIYIFSQEEVDDVTLNQYMCGFTMSFNLTKVYIYLI